MDDRSPLNAEALTFVQSLFSAARHGLTHSELSHLLAQFYLEEAQSRGDRSLLEVARSSADIRAIEILEDLEEQGLVEAGDMVRTKYPERLWRWVGPLPAASPAGLGRFHHRLARLFQGRKTFIGDERKVCEQPYQQIRAGSLTLAAQTLSRIQFIQSKCMFGHYQELVQDYQDLIAQMRAPDAKATRTELPRVEAFRDYLVVFRDEILFHVAEQNKGNWLAGMMLRDEPTGPLGREARRYVRISDAPYMLLLRTLSAPTRAQARGEDRGHRFTALTAAANADRIVAGHESGKLSLWRFSSVKAERLISTGEGEVTSLALTPDGSSCISGHETGGVRVVDLRPGAKARVVSLGDEEILTVDLTPEGRLAVSGDVSGLVRVVDVESGAQLFASRQEGTAIVAARFSGDGRALLWASSGSPTQSQAQGGQVTLTDLTSGEPVKQVPLESAPESLAFAPGAQDFLVACADGTLRRYVIRDTQEDSRTHRESAFFSLCASGGSENLLSGGSDGVVRYWDTRFQVGGAFSCGDHPAHVAAFWTYVDVADERVSGSRVAVACGDLLHLFWLPLVSPWRRPARSPTVWLSTSARDALRSSRRILSPPLQPFEVEDDGLIHFPGSMPLTWCSACGYYIPVHPGTLRPPESPWTPPPGHKVFCPDCGHRFRVVLATCGAPPGTPAWWE